MEIIAAIWLGIALAVGVPEVYYQKNTHESCPEFRKDTTAQQRDYCYLKQDIAEHQEEYSK